MDAGDVVGEMMAMHEKAQLNDVLGKLIYGLVVATVLCGLFVFFGFLAALLIFGGGVLAFIFLLIGFPILWKGLQYLKRKLIVKRHEDLCLGYRWKLVVVFVYLIFGGYYIVTHFIIEKPSVISVLHQGRSDAIQIVFPYCNENRNITFKEKTDWLSLRGVWQADGQKLLCQEEDQKEIYGSITLSTLEISSVAENAKKYPSGMTQFDKINKDKIRLIEERNGAKVYREILAGNRSAKEIIVFQADDGEFVVVQYLLALPNNKYIYHRFDSEREVEFFLRYSGNNIGFYRQFDQNAMKYLRSLVKK
ncbi:hypothetical protein [Chitinibacter sp. S2-10]|uniref:hypothetical protein n=1 Tax=Chitinibacter sp. S2-10 TaxID=3373597 RepID=UPI00397772A8